MHCGAEQVGAETTEPVTLHMLGCELLKNELAMRAATRLAGMQEPRALMIS